MKETVEQFNRTLCDDLFQETMKDLDNLNTRDGTFDYADYVALNNDVCALYDSFSMIDSIIEALTFQLAQKDGEIADYKGFGKGICCNMCKYRYGKHLANFIDRNPCSHCSRYYTDKFKAEIKDGEQNVKQD